MAIRSLQDGTQERYSLRLTPYLELLSVTPREIIKVPATTSNNNWRKPERTIVFSGGQEAKGLRLCIIPGWFAAKRRHLLKFANVYLNQDFDVLILSSSPSVLVHPMGSLKVTPFTIFHTGLTIIVILNFLRKSAGQRHF